MQQVTSKNNCTGCAACMNTCPKQCIEMQADNEGFLFPIIDAAKCIDCGLCQRICPQNQQIQAISIPNFKVVEAAKSIDDKILNESSSGGIFTHLAEYVIKQNGVVFGAKFDSEWNVVHDFVDNITDLHYLKKSKYVQSNIDKTYSKAKEYLQQDKYVMFCGTPCQIIGLKHFLQHDYDKLFTIDFVCHGVPSPGIWIDYLNSLKIPRSLITKIDFRDKTIAWSPFQLVVDTNDKHIVEQQYSENVFTRGFNYNLYLRQSCDMCKIQGNSGSDITIADFWGVKKYMPEFYSDRGVSLVFVSTQKGLSFWTECSKTNIEHKPIINSKFYTEKIPQLFGKRHVNRNRSNFFKEYNHTNLDVLVNKYTKISAMQKFKNKVKALLKKFIR